MNAASRLLRSPTHVALLLGMACSLLVGASFFVQHVLEIDPCPLCILQRYTYATLVPVFFAAAWARPHGRPQQVLLTVAAFLVAGGLGVAAYQTQLQLFPPPVTATCSASLSYMLDTLAATEVLARLFQATGDCSDTSFKVLGLTLAQASMLVFLAFSAILATVLLRARAPNRKRGG
jgi:disulfide bond formation protein DsbB